MNSPRQFLGCIALVIRDYDEAIEWYCRKLGFELMEDTRLSETKRWVLIAPPGSSQTRLQLARAATPQQEAFIGRQSGGRVFLFLHTDDFWRDYHAYVDRGVRFVREPKTEPYGTVAVFEDLYGNLWDLVQPSTERRTAAVSSRTPPSAFGQHRAPDTRQLRTRNQRFPFCVTGQ